MKRSLFSFLCICSFLISNAQTVQTSIGSPGITESFYDTKIDPADGSTVNVGFRNNASSGMGNDLFIVKKTTSNTIAWQKSISNSGDDIFYKVIVCSNGDYVACGHMFVAGVRRAVITRFNGTTGATIWTSRSAAGTGELFWDVIETTSNNLAVVGADSYVSGTTNSFVVLLNAAGGMIWSRVSSVPAADEFRTIQQLPNGNLIVGGFYNPTGTFYRTTILELTEANATILSQNIYNFNTSVGGAPTSNSLVPYNIAVQNGIVLIYSLAFQGFGTGGIYQAVYTYDQATKNLTGNFYYQPGKSGATGYSFSALSENDFLISQSYSTPATYVGVSRITNGIIAYDRKVNSNVTSIFTLDTYNGSASFGGSFTNTNIDAYNLTASVTLPAVTSPCNISDVNTLTQQVSNIPATASAVTTLSVGNNLSAVGITYQDLTYSVNTICAPIVGTPETIQIKIGNGTVSESFIDSKIDPTDEGSINVGYINNPASGNSYDLFMVKLNANHQMVWQRTIPNPGDDIFYRVIVCANGDYLACGYMFVGGLRKAVACRINSQNGNIIWSYRSTNNSAGELFWDVIETSDNNIALVGAESYTSGLTNSFVVSLNSSGSTLWSFISTTPLADECRSVAQLPNGNLLVAGFYNPSGNYHASIMEMNSSTGAVLSQNTYNINASVPGGLTNNSLWSGPMFIRNNTASIGFLAFQGFTSAITQCIYNYDLTTKSLTGNIYYQPGKGNATGYSFYALSENDFLISQSYSTPSVHVAVSRITNGIVVFDRKINSNVNTIAGMDIFNAKSIFTGNFNSSGLDAFDLFSSTNIPASSFPCDISDINTLTLQASNLSPTSLNAIVFTGGPALSPSNLIAVDPAYIVEDVCGFVIPVTLVDFKGTYKPETTSTLLYWSTSTEQNSKAFLIERSTDGGRSFKEIGSVNANGNSNSLLNYEFNDEDPYNGINFYRLKQVDMDGKFQYSKIISIDARRKSNGIYSVYPVPARSFTFVKSSEAEVEYVDIMIVDALGKIVNRKRSVLNNAQPVKLDLNSISPGLYYVKVLSIKNKTTTIKLIVK